MSETCAVSIDQRMRADIAEAITDRPWDMREFGARDPDGNMLYFGEHLERIGQ